MNTIQFYDEDIHPVDEAQEIERVIDAELPYPLRELGTQVTILGGEVYEIPTCQPTTFGDLEVEDLPY